MNCAEQHVAGARCPTCGWAAGTDFADELREQELLEAKHPREAYELWAAEEAVVSSSPFSSTRRRHEARLARAKAAVERVLEEDRRKGAA